MHAQGAAVAAVPLRRGGGLVLSAARHPCLWDGWRRQGHQPLRVCEVCHRAGALTPAARACHRGARQGALRRWHRAATLPHGRAQHPAGAAHAAAPPLPATRTRARDRPHRAASHTRLLRDGHRPGVHDARPGRRQGGARHRALPRVATARPADGPPGVLGEGARRREHPRAGGEGGWHAQALGAAARAPGARAQLLHRHAAALVDSAVGARMLHVWGGDAQEGLGAGASAHLRGAPEAPHRATRHGAADGSQQQPPRWHVPSSC
mmetsp:Transcript_6067/g.13220  ORF Transcript_6067/g.13220 Transcript_6067/m.13220 type:complete len:265 (+) Transcript_6067:405-1199(+)